MTTKTAAKVENTVPVSLIKETAHVSGLTDRILAEEWDAVYAGNVERIADYPHMNPNVGAFIRVAIHVLSNRFTGKSVSQTAFALNSFRKRVGIDPILTDESGKALPATVFANVAKCHQGNAVKGIQPATAVLVAAALSIPVSAVMEAEARDADIRKAMKAFPAASTVESMTAAGM